jgi:glucose-6-phosphate 1-dehydrogenase
MRRHEHTEYPVNDVGVTLTDRGDEMKTVIVGSLLQTPESPETYASLTLQVNSPQWAGVPFTLRSCKALAADSAEIAIHFRPPPDTCSTNGLGQV